MRLKSKTTATLIAAILIAMTCAIPALAQVPSEPVVMTIIVSEPQGDIVSITVAPTEINFDPLIWGGVTDGLDKLVITNGNSNVDIVITASVPGELVDDVAFYNDYLLLKGDGVNFKSITDFNTATYGINVGGADLNVYLQINLSLVPPVPVPAPESTTYTANLVFWATG